MIARLLINLDKTRCKIKDKQWVNQHREGIQTQLTARCLEEVVWIVIGQSVGHHSQAAHFIIDNVNNLLGLSIPEGGHTEQDDGNWD